MINLNNLKERGKSDGQTVKPHDFFLFDKYIKEIKRYEPLSREEEIELFKRIEKNGDKEAIDKICKHNLRFVVSVAIRYSKTLTNLSLSLEDLINEANIGLYLAIKKFDYHTGNKFISFAVWIIRGQLSEYIQNNIKTIRIPANITSTVNKAKRQELILEQKLGRTPTTLEIFETMVENGETKHCKNVTKLDSILNVSLFEGSLNHIQKNKDRDIELCELLKSDSFNSESRVLDRERKELILKMMDCLPSDVKNYFNDFFGLEGQKPLKYIDMARKYGEDPQVISKTIKRYLITIRDKNKEKEKYFFCD